MRKLVCVLSLSAIALIGCGDQGETDVRTAAGGSSERAPGQAPDPSGDPDDLVSVGDEHGEVRGTFPKAAEDRRHDRMVELVVEGGLLEKAETSAERAPILAALNVVDPLTVTDEDGRHVGYYTDAFVELDEYESMRAEAQLVLDAAGG